MLLGHAIKRACILFLFTCASLLSRAKGDACRNVATTPCPLSGYYSNVSIVAVTPTALAQVESLYTLCKFHCHCHLWNNEVPLLDQVNVYLLSLKSVLTLNEEFPSSTYKILKRNIGPDVASSARQQANYTADPDYLQKQGRVIDDGFYNAYFTLDVLYEKWRQLERIYSPNITLERFGTTYEGRPMHALRVGHTDVGEPRRVMLNALQHSREWVTTCAATFVVEALAQEMITGVTNALDKVQVIVVPVSNSDGYNFTRGADRLWRKNRRCGFPCYGVDLNRNWDADFDGRFSTSSDTCSNEYVGAAPFSEPETAALRDFILGVGGVRAHIDLHSYGDDVLGAYQFSSKMPPHAQLIDLVGHAVTDALSNTHGSDYKFSRGSENTVLYPASGFMSDWAFLQGIMSFTVEVRPKSSDFVGAGFLLDEKQIRPTCEEVLEGVKALIRYATVASRNLTEVKTDNYGLVIDALRDKTRPIIAHANATTIAFHSASVIAMFFSVISAFAFVFISLIRRKQQEVDETSRLITQSSPFSR